ncbi:MAG: RHS repeat-associated core domain-containing protein, partial [Candidatus Moraniibacteriota bacterium]
MQKKKLRFFPKTTLVVFLIFSFVAPSPFAVWQAMQKEKQITLFEQQEKLTPKEGEDMAIEEAAQLKKNNIEKIPAGMATDLAPTQFNANVLQKAKLAKIKKTVDPMKLGGKTIAENYAGASYNEEKKKLTIDEPIGEIKEVVFNEQNLPTKTTDTAGNTTEAKYDSLGNMLEMVNPNGDVVHYNYDKQGRLLASYVEKAAQKNKTLSFWDKLFSANSAVADTKDEVVNLAYADNNELGNIENQAGVVTQEFTENGDLSVSVDASGNLNSYEYDDNGNVIGKKTNAPVEQLSMLSSLFVNAAEETVTEQASFSYDEEGNPESSDITISIPETEEEVALADQKTLVDKLLSFLPRVSAKKMTLKKISKTGEYDEQGNLVGMKNQAGEVTAFYYDENDNPVGGATADRDGNLIFEAKYTRNEQGNWAARQDNLGNEENYTYDERGQLIKYSINGQETTYAYDERGNLVSEKNTVGELLYTYEHNKLVKVEKPDGSTKSFVYDANGNLIEKTTCADSENCQTVFYTYTTNNYLQSVTMPGKETVFYIYDGLNRRVQKTFGNKTLTYLWEGNRITGEMDENKNIVRSFVYDQEGNLLSVIKDGAVFNLIKDSHGSTVALTDENSQIVARYTYDAWGNPAQTLENSITPFLYSGYYYDQDIEAYIMGPRFYDPALKRFFQKDPAPADLNDELTLNEYIYCENNPVNNYDPDGHKSKAKNDGKSDKAAKEKAEKAAKEAEKREAEQKKKEEEARKKAEKEKEEQAKKAKEAAAKEKAKAEELKKKAKEEAERKAQEVKKKEAEAKKKAEEAAARAKKEIEEK